MTISAVIDEAKKEFKSLTSLLDAEVLLCFVIQKDRAWIKAHDNDEITDKQYIKYQKLISRRANNEPVAYILGYKEFYGRDFYVNKDVLVPRPESETMIDLLLKKYEARSTKYGDRLQIVDVGTGSGNLIITASLEMSKVESRRLKVGYIGLDISKKALLVAEKNSKVLKTDVEFKQFDLLKEDLSSVLPPAGGPESSICILANLPYVPNDYPINEPAMHEPEIALFSGDDGLDHYRQLFKQLSKFTVYSLQFSVLTEALTFQHYELERIAKSAGFKLSESKDLIQVFEQVRSTKREVRR